MNIKEKKECLAYINECLEGRCHTNQRDIHLAHMLSVKHQFEDDIRREELKLHLIHEGPKLFQLLSLEPALYKLIAENL